VVGHLYELVVARARDYPRGVAFGGQQELGWRTLDGREVLALVDRLAAELAERGVAEGDRVVVWAPGGWRTPLYLFALWRLGAVVVPFDRDMNPTAARRILAAVEPRCVLAGYVDRPAWTQSAPLLEWWEPGEGPAPATPVGAAWSRPAEELAAICYTSGSTGDPKGCQITHANLCFQVDVGPRVISTLFSISGSM